MHIKRKILLFRQIFFSYPQIEYCVTLPTKMGVGPSAILGSTNKFFMPWLVPRNQKDTVHAPTIFGKLGRKRREIETEELAQDVITCEWYPSIRSCLPFTLYFYNHPNHNLIKFSL